MKYYLDTRVIGKDGRCPLRLRIRKDGKTALPLTGIRISPSAWDDRLLRSTDSRLNTRLRDILDNAEDYVLRLKMDGAYDGMTVSDLADAIIRKALPVDSKPSRRDVFATHLVKYRDRQRRSGTRNLYDWTLRSLCEFDPGFQQRTFRQIDFNYLSELERWCESRGMKVNTISVLMRNIRAVFNDAIKDGITRPLTEPRCALRINTITDRNNRIEVIEFRHIGLAIPGSL